MLAACTYVCFFLLYVLTCLSIYLPTYLSIYLSIYLFFSILAHLTRIGVDFEFKGCYVRISAFSLEVSYYI